MIRRHLEGAQRLLNQLSAFALVINIFLLCFVHREDAKLLAFRERTLVLSLLNYSVEYRRTEPLLCLVRVHIP